MRKRGKFNKEAYRYKQRLTVLTAVLCVLCWGFRGAGVSVVLVLTCPLKKFNASMCLYSDLSVNFV